MTRIMTRNLVLAALGLMVAGPMAATPADAFFIKANGTKATGRAASVADTSSTLGLRADQLRVGSKRWFEQMEREGRLGGPRG